nr:hypothetical protein B11C_190054 [Bartonella sp. 1-1C]
MSIVKSHNISFIKDKTIDISSIEDIRLTLYLIMSRQSLVLSTV